MYDNRAVRAWCVDASSRASGTTAALAAATLELRRFAKLKAADAVSEDACNMAAFDALDVETKVLAALKSSAPLYSYALNSTPRRGHQPRRRPPALRPRLQPTQPPIQATRHLARGRPAFWSGLSDVGLGTRGQGDLARLQAA